MSAKAVKEALEYHAREHCPIDPSEAARLAAMLTDAVVNESYEGDAFEEHRREARAWGCSHEPACNTPEDCGRRRHGAHCPVINGAPELGCACAPVPMTSAAQPAFAERAVEKMPRTGEACLCEEGSDGSPKCPVHPDVPATSDVRKCDAYYMTAVKLLYRCTEPEGHDGDHRNAEYKLAWSKGDHGPGAEKPRTETATAPLARAKLAYEAHASHMLAWYPEEFHAATIERWDMLDEKEQRAWLRAVEASDVPCRESPTPNPDCILHKRMLDEERNAHAHTKRLLVAARGHGRAVAQAADRMRAHEVRLDAVFRAAQAHRETETRVEWPWNEGYRLNDWQRTGGALDTALKAVADCAREEQTSGGSEARTEGPSPARKPGVDQPRGSTLDYDTTPARGPEEAGTFKLNDRVLIRRTGREGVIEGAYPDHAEPRWYVRLSPDDAGWRCTSDLTPWPKGTAGHSSRAEETCEHGYYTLGALLQVRGHQREESAGRIEMARERRGAGLDAGYLAKLVRMTGGEFAAEIRRWDDLDERPSKGGE